MPLGAKELLGLVRTWGHCGVDHCFSPHHWMLGGLSAVGAMRVRIRVLLGVDVYFGVIGTWECPK